MGCRPWHSAPWSHFLRPGFLITASGRSVCSSPQRAAAQGETPSFGAHLSFRTTQLRRIWGSEHMEQPRSWGRTSGQASKPTRSTPRPQRFWHALFSLRSYAWAAFCLSPVKLWLATHPSQSLEGRCSWLRSICCPSLRSAEGSQHKQRWAVDGTGGSGGTIQETWSVFGTQRGIRCKKRLNYGNSRQK